jgi:hypothetical protein
MSVLCEGACSLGVRKPFKGCWGVSGVSCVQGGVTAPWIVRPRSGSGKRLRLSGRSQLSWKFTENKL